jgi:hypothetical protein
MTISETLLTSRTNPTFPLVKLLMFAVGYANYDANTSGGMSGGPVFYLNNGILVPIGMHVEPVEYMDGIYFIPFAMPELLAELRNIGVLQ